MRARPILLLAFLAACTQEGTPFWADGGGLVAIAQEDGSTRFLHKVDGSVIQVLRGEFTASEEQFAILTGNGSGIDQGRVILLSGAGMRLAHYTCSGRTPFRTRGGRSLVQIQRPQEGSFESFWYRDRRFMVFTSLGGYAPSALIVLEATGRTKLTERLICWHYGHLHQVGRGDGILAGMGLNNRLENRDGRYGAGLIVVDLDELVELPIEGGPWTRMMPHGTDEVLEGPVRYYVEFPFDEKMGEHNRSIRIEGGRVHAGLVDGLTYVLEVATGRGRIEASSWYRQEYDRRRATNQDLPETPEARVQALLSSVIVHRRP